jgi:8-oxo-dGTP diphosphatase
VRELREELGIEATVGRALPAVRHVYPWVTIELLPFVCSTAAGEPGPREHAEVRWVTAREARPLPWSPADIPVLENYLALKGI